MEQLILLKSVLFIFIFYIVASQSNDGDGVPLKSYQFECIEEAKVDAALVIQLKAGEIWDKNYPALKTWSLCVLRKVNLMSKEGVFRLDVAMKRIQESDKKAAEKLIDECLSPKELPPEEIAWQYIKCHHQKDKEGNFSIITIV